MKTYEELEKENKDLYHRLNTQVAMRLMADAKVNAIRQLLINECVSTEDKLLEKIENLKHCKEESKSEIQVNEHEAIKSDCFLRGYLALKNQMIPLIFLNSY